ncbi:Maf family protein [Bacillus massiliglaciei]|uniref:Maf family protein n=1 Tax=Bacillus massiliglaciei TaxID=1816693 RepID=UPI000AAF81AF|nr:Maf family protein [Bacillus massiliglaciei]
MQPLILASSSPRRKELIRLLQIPFEAVPADVSEDFEPGTPAEQVVQELALRKAKAVALSHESNYVIGSDTVVVLDGEILGKPADRGDAKRMLLSLSGRDHYVCTGAAIVQGSREKVFAEKTKVTFWELSEAEIDRYLDSGEPFDKAGSYGIQGYGSLLVKKLDGDYYTVVGLPVARLSRELKSMHAGC